MSEFTVAGDMPAYGAMPGDTIRLDASDPRVMLSVQAGVLEPSGEPGRMTCPACAEHIKRPPKLSEDEFAEHYAEKHPALVVPEWKEEA